MDIKRDKYLEDLINRMHESHIVAIELDQRKDKKYRDPRQLHRSPQPFWK